MSKTALSHLHQQIDAIRREAFAEGYTAAMQAVREFTARPTGRSVTEAAAVPAASKTAARSARPPARRRGRPAAKARPSASGKLARGTNARLVDEVLQEIAPRAARPAEIRNRIRDDKGVAIGFTSLRHALGQLEARQAIEQVADTKSWRHLPHHAASA